MPGTSYDQKLAAPKNFDNSTAVDDPLRRSKEEIWVSGTRNQARKCAIKREAKNYIISLIDEMWIFPLKDPDTFLPASPPSNSSPNYVS